MVGFNELVYWNSNAYGSAKRIKKNVVRSFLVGLCLLTFGTNWLIPFIPSFVKSDLVVRYA